MRIIVAGSRGVQDEELIFSFLDKSFGKSIDKIQYVINGMAKGPDTIGGKWGKARGINVKEMPADWDKYGKQAGYLRNVDMANDATHCIIFWDGISPGSKHMLDIAIEKSLWVKLVKIHG